MAVGARVGEEREDVNTQRPPRKEKLERKAHQRSCGIGHQFCHEGFAAGQHDLVRTRREHQDDSGKEIKKPDST